MKFTSMAFLGLISMVAASDHHLRAKSLLEIDMKESSCLAAKTQSACSSATDSETNEACVWCKCAAVPPVCVSPEESKGLPPGVFECDAASAGNNVFEFGETKTLQLREKVSEKGSSDGEFCDASSKSISGYMDLSGSKFDQSGDKHLFFWMFEKRDSEEDVVQDEDIPLVVWLTGGPGCSSTLALLSENGPCSVNEDGTGTEVNPNSWTEAAHVLWLDQPAGVGFSYGDENDSGEEMVGEDAYYFFQAFFKAHPEYVNNPLYIIGESYGGHYVPAISHRIWEGNNKLCDDCIELNFAGLAIGNGLTAPEHQYPWYPEMVWNNSHGIKVVDESVYNAMKSAVPACTKLIHQCNAGDSTIDGFACQAAFITCNMALTSPYQATGLNPYDIRKQCEVRPLCYDFSNVKKWLNMESTKQSLGVDEDHSHSWEACNFGINMKFHVDWMKDFGHFVADLLNAGFPALIYAGDVDFICNYLGNEAWTKELVWDHTDEFNKAESHDWSSGAGVARASNGLTFLQVVDGGHMVPADQPEVSLDMLKTFLAGEEF
mmetsp:Transcript_21668/g.53755  ORF Transcript_21668/g.53755 Transcript_21668/m.53755 type:complete len:546 (-) Transcript_21668:863-2500(-)